MPLASLVAREHHEVVVKHIEGFDFHDDVVRFEHAGEPWEIYGPSADLSRDLAERLVGVDRRRSRKRQAELDHFAARRWG